MIGQKLPLIPQKTRTDFIGHKAALTRQTYSTTFIYQESIS